MDKYERRAERRRKGQEKLERQYNRYWTDPDKRAEADFMQSASADLGMSYYTLKNTKGGRAALEKYKQTYQAPGAEPEPPQVDPDTGVPPGEPDSPQYPGGGAPTGTGGGNPLVPGYPGFPVSGTPPGTSTSELTPRQALPAFIPNFEAFFNPGSTAGSSPSYVDSRWYHRIEDPYSGPINQTQMPGFIPPQYSNPMMSPISPTFNQPKHITSGLPQIGSMTMSGMSNPMMSGNTFGQFSPNSSIGGGMLGNAGKGIFPTAIGGMLSRNYYG